MNEAEWAVEARYPGDWPEATEAEARSAVREARDVWASARRDLTNRAFDVDDAVAPQTNEDEEDD